MSFKIDGYFIYGFSVGLVAFTLAQMDVIPLAVAFCTLPIVCVTSYAHATLAAK